MKYTTGKWKYDFDDDTKSGLKVYTDDEMICDFVGGSNLAEARANAKLIAAAPALLEALKDACERMERARGILKREDGISNWGMLDTSDLMPTIFKATTQPHP